MGEVAGDGVVAIPPLAPPAAGVDDQQGSPTPLPLLIQASAAENPDRITSATTITALPAMPMNKAVLVACIAFPHLLAHICTYKSAARRGATLATYSTVPCAAPVSALEASVRGRNAKRWTIPGRRRTR